MDLVENEGRLLLDDLSEDEVETVFDRVVAPAPVEAMAAEAPATSEVSERLHSLVGRSEMRQLAEDEMASLQSTADPDEWFVESEGKSVGPLTTEEVKERWSQGLIGPDTPCWSAGLQGWLPVCRVPALTQALAPPPPPELAPRQLKLPEVELSPRASEALRGLVRPRPPAPPPAPPVAPVEKLAAPPQFVPWLPPQPPPPAPEPRSSGAGSARIALYVTLSAIAGSIAGAVLLGVFALHLLQASPAQAPVPAPIAATPTPAPMPAPAAVTAAPAIHPAPAPMAEPPKALAVEKPKRVAAAPKPEPAAARESEGEGSEGSELIESTAKPNPKLAPMPKEDPEVVNDFDEVFGAQDGQKASKPERTVYVPPAPGGAAPKAQLSQSEIMQVVVAHKAEIRKCKEAAEEAIPGISGKLVMRWSVTTSGEVEDVEALSGDLEGTALADCVANAIRGWKFPEHTEAQPPVTFPFVF